jgi:hypothetical protein
MTSVDFNAQLNNHIEVPGCFQLQDSGFTKEAREIIVTHLQRLLQELYPVSVVIITNFDDSDDTYANIESV